jgi:hypothetical protein
VPHQVHSRRKQTIRIITELAKPHVAGAAQELSNLTRLVVVIEVKSSRPRVFGATDGTESLPLKAFLILIYRDPVSALSVVSTLRL